MAGVLWRGDLLHEPRTRPHYLRARGAAHHGQGPRRVPARVHSVLWFPCHTGRDGTGVCAAGTPGLLSLLLAPEEPGSGTPRGAPQGTEGRLPQPTCLMGTLYLEKQFLNTQIRPTNNQTKLAGAKHACHKMGQSTGCRARWATRSPMLEKQTICSPQGWEQLGQGCGSRLTAQSNPGVAP